MGWMGAVCLGLVGRGLGGYSLVGGGVVVRNWLGTVGLRRVCLVILSFPHFERGKAIK
jgi:hypothetical protein